MVADVLAIPRKNNTASPNTVRLLVPETRRGQGSSTAALVTDENRHLAANRDLERYSITGKLRFRMDQLTGELVR